MRWDGRDVHDGGRRVAESACGLREWEEGRGVEGFGGHGGLEGACYVSFD